MHNVLTLSGPGRASSAANTDASGREGPLRRQFIEEEQNRLADPANNGPRDVEGHTMKH